MFGHEKVKSHQIHTDRKSLISPKNVGEMLLADGLESFLVAMNEYGPRKAKEKIRKISIPLGVAIAAFVGSDILTRYFTGKGISERIYWGFKKAYSNMRHNLKLHN